MRKTVALALAVSLSACQTTPAKPGFSREQVALMMQEGFKPVGDNYELGIADRVLFAVDVSDLVPENAAVIDSLARKLASVGIHGATVEGHTDSTGSDEYNQKLSERRAASVSAAMVAGGLAPGEVRAVGLGESDPIESNDTEAGRAQNRRVVVVVSPMDAARR